MRSWDTIESFKGFSLGKHKTPFYFQAPDRFKLFVPWWSPPTAENPAAWVHRSLVLQDSSLGFRKAGRSLLGLLSRPYQASEGTRCCSQPVQKHPPHLLGAGGTQALPGERCGLPCKLHFSGRLELTAAGIARLFLTLTSWLHLSCNVILSVIKKRH